MSQSSIAPLGSTWWEDGRSQINLKKNNENEIVWKENNEENDIKCGDVIICYS